VQSMTAISDRPWVILLIINAILLVLGCSWRGSAIMLLTIPIFMPVLRKYGLARRTSACNDAQPHDGLLTPPVGMVLYAISTIGDVRSSSSSGADTFIIAITVRAVSDHVTFRGSSCGCQRW